MSAHDEKALLISNFIFLLASLVALIRVFIYFLNDDINYSLISLTSAFLFASLYYLNTRGYYDIAKFGLIIVGSLATGYKELQTGGHGGQIYLIMASFGVNFLLFSAKETKKLVFANLITFTNLFIVVVFPNLINNDQPLPWEEKREIIIGAFSNILITVFVIWYFVKKSSDIELKLIDTNHQLIDTNKEIIIKNEQIEERNIELKDLYDDLVKQKDIIEIKNEEIFASIRYAERIQSAFLPKNLNEISSIKESFVYFKPKDIVSGDFYWWAETHENVFICTADCTGHGVPGAMLSMLGMVALNDAVKVLGIKDLDLILEYTDNYLVEHIKKDKSSLRDGIELSMVKYSKSDDRVFISGAKRPILIFSDGELLVFKPSRRFIGERNVGNKEFQNIEVQKNKGAQIYLFSDGYPDQANEKRKKIGIKRFRELVANFGEKAMSEQKEILAKYFEDHIGSEDQRDDVTVLGIKF